jgi:hypothetical protein
MLNLFGKIRDRKCRGTWFFSRGARESDAAGRARIVEAKVTRLEVEGADVEA